MREGGYAQRSDKDRRGRGKWNGGEDTARVRPVWETEERGREWGKGERQRLHWQILLQARLRTKKAFAHRHYRSILTDLLLPSPANNSSSLQSSDTYSWSVHWRNCGYATLTPHWEPGGERERRCGGWIRLLYVCLCRDTAPLLMLSYLLPPTHYHSVSLSLPPEARTLSLAAWQPLVSLTQLLCCLSHSHTHTHPSSSTSTGAAE